MNCFILQHKIYNVLKSQFIHKKSSEVLCGITNICASDATAVICRREGLWRFMVDGQASHKMWSFRKLIVLITNL